MSRWDKESKAVRAVQLAFDVGDEVNRQIRIEALERGINPPDRIREILGLPVQSRPVRPRLSISLSDDDFEALARAFGVEPTNRLKIRQIAAERLVRHVGGERQKQ